MRQAGILLSISSLPSLYGIGSLGRGARDFIDFLTECRQSVWQVLPIGQTSYGDSPYQSPSAFAGNPYFIDPDMLSSRGLLTTGELRAAEQDTEKVDYSRLFESRFSILKKAYSRFDAKDADYVDFCRENAAWLDDYAVFMAVKEAHGYRAWYDWEDELARAGRDALADAYERGADFWRFVQYEFYMQWEEMHRYARERGIEIIGDIPIYVALDSAEVLFHPEDFLLDSSLRPTLVAGCPPDRFAEGGQLWGNPIYDWKAMKAGGYTFWIERIRWAMKCFDRVRIDHFRGFRSYYAIPYGDKDARRGHWEDGPGCELFDVLREKVPQAKIIAEDLGFIDDDVRKMLAAIGYPGMKVLQFGFDSDDSEYHPAHYTENCVAYTGTHDNMTGVEWYDKADESTRERFAASSKITDSASAARLMVELVMESRADLAVIPMQDYMQLGCEARMNTPSTLGGNWEWRLPLGYASERLMEEIRSLTVKCGRDTGKHDFST